MWGFGLFHPGRSIQKTNAQSHLQFVYSIVQLKTCHQLLPWETAPWLRGLTDRTVLLGTG